MTSKPAGDIDPIDVIPARAIVVAEPRWNRSSNPSPSHTSCERVLMDDCSSLPGDLSPVDGRHPLVGISGGRAELKTAGSMADGRASVDVGAPIIEPERVVASVAPAALKQRLIAADVLVVGVAVVLAFVWHSLVRSGAELGVQRSHLVLAFVSFPIWIVSFALNNLYQARAVERPAEEFRRIINGAICSVGTIVALSFVFQFKTLSRLWVLSLLGFAIIGMTIERRIARRIFIRMRLAGVISRPVLIVGTDGDAIGLLHAAQRAPELGYRIVGFVGPDEIGTRGGCQVLGDIDATTEVLQATGATGVLISLSSVGPETVNRLTRELTDGGYHVALSSGLHDIDVVRFRAQDVGGRTLIYVEQVRRGGWRAIAKRAFDITIALVALVVTAPVAAIAALAIKRTSPGPGHLPPGARRPRR